MSRPDAWAAAYTAAAAGRRAGGEGGGAGEGGAAGGGAGGPAGRGGGRAAALPRAGRLLDELARQAVKERPPAAGDLEPLLRAAAGAAPGAPEGGAPAGGGSLVRALEGAGYLRGGRNWLTARAFDEIGDRMLRDVTRRLAPSGRGQHATARPGPGEADFEGSRPAGPRCDARSLDAARTVLNAVSRAARAGRPSPPFEVLPEDLEEADEREEARASVAYCIDLSSTMRTRLGRTSRIEVAKRALWCLCALNRRAFPADDVHVVGFASLACRAGPRDVPFLRTFDANDDHLHYTNYQAALRLSRRLLRRGAPGSRRIVLITDGQPTACFVDSDREREAVLSERPYATFYSPDAGLLARAGAARGVRIDAGTSGLVYLSYRHRRVDPRVDASTAAEARRCAAEGIGIDTMVVSDEAELLEYAGRLERRAGGRTYHISDEGMDRVAVADYMEHSRKVFTKTAAL